MDAVERYLGETERSVRALSRDEVRRVAAALFDASRWDKHVWIAAAMNAASGARLARILYDVANLGTLADVGRAGAGDVLIVLGLSGEDSRLSGAVERAKERGALSIAFCRHDDVLAAAADLRIGLEFSDAERAQELVAIAGRAVALALRERVEHYAVGQANAAAAGGSR